MSTIYKHFAEQTLLPIRLKDVKAFILKTGEVSLIARFPIDDMDDLVLRGMLRVYRDRPPYAIEDRVMAQIAYYSGLHPYEVRLVCCKEMLHLLDNHRATASDRDKVSKLVEEITLPIEAVASIPGLLDHTKMLHALAILLPPAALTPLREAHQNGKLSAENVAQIARIPEEWARLALSEAWIEVCEKLKVNFMLDKGAKAA
jgi:hypothetical protein